MLAVLPSAIAAALGPSLNASVETTSGPVKGHVADWPEKAGVLEYLGIPYAEPPVGDLRFMKPEPLKAKRQISGEKFVSSMMATQ